MTLRNVRLGVFVWFFVFCFLLFNLYVPSYLVCLVDCFTKVVTLP